jgi:hypothetical protein
MAKKKDKERTWSSHVLVPPAKQQLDNGYIHVIETDRGGTEFRAKRAKNDILAFYFRNGHITPEQLRAGNRFRVLYQYGFELRERYVLMRFGTSSGEVDDATLLDLVTDYRNAKKAIRSLKGKAVAHDVCCLGYPAGHRRMYHLREALDELAAHFQSSREKNTHPLDK